MKNDRTFYDKFYTIIFITAAARRHAARDARDRAEVAAAPTPHSRALLAAAARNSTAVIAAVASEIHVAAWRAG